ncbi:alpha/beta hydrolase family esterase [Nonomuraea lactucae]|uniref:extracellular catalytic domain type 1 short-chain-length polyhydroxyalkanoate depolymerase n=1 Tax=Nonomuraea lactucae TaxID=2249762 RepID=UPI000DE2F27E|nr:PHB depolymerase family esterase [Nonomuraea lactucae]
MTALLQRTPVRLVLVLILAIALVGVARPSRAASLTKVAAFGSNPGGLGMWVYLPDGLPAGAPLVLALHGCTQDANAYFTGSGWRKYADRHGFALVFPERIDASTFPSNCFRWFAESDIRRGQGQALSIAQMVWHAVSAYGVDAGRVHVTGLSAGGAMAAVMLAAYPDLFRAGSVVAGLPYRCSPPASTGACMGGQVTRSPEQWGDLVRGAAPGFGGRRPKVAVWHGQADYLVDKVNGEELRDQFTDVAGVSQTPTSVTGLPGGTTLETYGQDDVRLYRVAGAGHGTPVDPGGAEDQCGAVGAFFLDAICSAYHDASFFGLTGQPGPSPSPSPTPTPMPTAPVQCFTADNYAHTLAGRAHHSGGYAYANGSGQAMGLWNPYVTSTLRRTGPGYFVVVPVRSC